MLLCYRNLLKIFKERNPVEKLHRTYDRKFFKCALMCDSDEQKIWRPQEEGRSISDHERRGRLAINRDALFMRRSSSADVAAGKKTWKSSAITDTWPAIISEQRCIERNEDINWRVLDGSLLTRGIFPSRSEGSLSPHRFLSTWHVVPSRVIFNLEDCIGAIV